MTRLNVEFVLKSGALVSVDCESGDMADIERRVREAATNPFHKQRFLLCAGTSRRYSTYIDLREVAALKATTARYQ